MLPEGKQNEKVIAMHVWGTRISVQECLSKICADVC